MKNFAPSFPAKAINAVNIVAGRLFLFLTFLGCFFHCCGGAWWDAETIVPCCRMLQRLAVHDGLMKLLKDFFWATHLWIPILVWTFVIASLWCHVMKVSQLSFQGKSVRTPYDRDSHQGFIRVNYPLNHQATVQRKDTQITTKEQKYMSTRPNHVISCLS